MKPLEDQIVHLHVLDVGPQQFGRIVDRDTDYLQAVGPVLLLELDEPRDLHLARDAPGGPEVEQDDLALIVRQLHVPAVHVLERKVEIGRLRIRRTCAAGGRVRRVEPQI